MSRTNNGGHAFPTDEYFDERRRGVMNGMSMRDYFAAAALPSVILARVDDDINQESIAEECYELADALLAERVKLRHDDDEPAITPHGEDPRD